MARRRLLALAGMLIAPWVVLGAQSSCLTAPAAHGSWPPPLDRQVSIGGGVMTVRDALDRAATAAGVHFTYAVELLPRDRQVCTGSAPVRLGDVLVQWLGGTRLQPVVAGADRIVLVPAVPAPSPVEDTSGSSLAPTQLAPVVVREEAPEAALGAVVVSRTVVTAREFDASGAPSLAAALSAVAPGVWMWSPAAASVGGGMVSMRGASSFGTSYPKVYVDGIEVASPLFLGQLPTDQVARVEIIRGPQGAALYGAGATGGVISITTRSVSGSGAGPGVSLRSIAGVSESAFAPLGTFVQDHAFAARLGTAQRSLGLGLSTATTGAFIPGAFSQQVHATAGAAFLGPGSRLQLAARYYRQRAGNATSPLLRGLVRVDSATSALTGSSSAPDQGTAAAVAADSSAAQHVAEYTVGGTLGLQGTRWVHTLVAGVDGYRLDDVSSLPGMVRTPGDSALLAASGGADRGTLRWNSAAQFGMPGRVAVGVTLAADHSILRDASLGTSLAPAGTPRSTLWRHTSGATAAGELSLSRTLVVNGGLRLERNAGFTILSGVAALPSVGAAWRRHVGPALVTLRTAWGKAIQPPRVAKGAAAWGGRVPTVLSLEPETQSGVEFGADVSIGSRFSTRLTRYDQRATNLVQPVASGSPGGHGMTYQLQNVGAISNRGWEVEGNLGLGSLTLSSALGLTDSRVARVAQAYTGDLRAGDRVLQVPARTVSVTATWLGRGWSGSWSLAQASDWLNYDWLALTTDSYLNPRAVRGAALRQYWRSYPAVTRLRAAFSRDVTTAFALLVTGDNLLGQQRGEPDNVTIVPGRTLRAGLRATF